MSYPSIGRWFYHGDVNVAHGGFWYRLDGWEHGYFDAVRVTSCSDAGAQGNAWWVEALTGIVPRDEVELGRVLSCCGYDLDGFSKAQQRHMIVDACIAYGLYDPANCFPGSHCETVQIGEVADSGRDLDASPTVILRANASLERYVRREFLNGRAA